MGKKASGEGSIYLIKTGKNKGLYGASITLEYRCAHITHHSCHAFT
jgi:hypothetical protein